MGLAESTIKESEKVTPGVNFDFDEAGRIVGIEVLNALTRLQQSALNAATNLLGLTLVMVTFDDILKTKAVVKQLQGR